MSSCPIEPPFQLGSPEMLGWPKLELSACPGL